MNFRTIKLATTILAVLCLGTSLTANAANGGGSANAASSAALDSTARDAERRSTGRQKPAGGDEWFTTNFDQVATLPAFSLSAPAGLVPSWGVVFASGGGISNAPGSDKLDAALGAGFGFGNAAENVGGAVTLGIGSISPDGGQLNRGNVGASLGHFFTDTLTAVSVGGQNLTGWNAGGGNPDASLYAAVTQILPNDYVPVIINGGIGNGGYYFLRSDKASTRNVAPFFSATAYVMPQIGLVADYTAGVTSAGVSLVPIASLPITVNLGAWDLFTYAPDHDNVSFMGSIAYAYTF